MIFTKTMLMLVKNIPTSEVMIQLLTDTLFKYIFESGEIREIGLKLLQVNLSPDLYTGITLAVLNASG